jgi:hypothetical protein
MSASLDVQSDHDNRRRERRNRTLKSGQIVFNGGFSSVACTVRNLSSGGALLELPSVVGVPREFQLKMDGSPLRACEIRWRDERHIGVKFL